jgi:hypothetical protein
MTVGKLCGFRNLATGDFVEALLYSAYKSGGLFYSMKSTLATLE